MSKVVFHVRNLSHERAKWLKLHYSVSKMDNSSVETYRLREEAKNLYFRMRDSWEVRYGPNNDGFDRFIQTGHLI